MLVITGASGFLGSNFVAEADRSGRAVSAVAHRNGVPSIDVPSMFIDLAQPDAAMTMMDELEPSCVINCAALASVDECESNRERATLLNATIPQLIARACARRGVRFAHISTDSVFDGLKGGYVENDATNPLNAYAASKLEGERSVLEAMPDALVIRTNFIGVAPKRGVGLAEWIADRLAAAERINGFTDVVFSPLVATDLAEIVMKMTDRGLEGVYHLAASDCISKYELARSIARALALDESLVDPARVADAALAAKRPLDTSLNPAKLESALKQRMATVQNAVDAFAQIRRSRKTDSRQFTTTN